MSWHWGGGWDQTIAIWETGLKGGREAVGVGTVSQGARAEWGENGWEVKPGRTGF